MATFTFTVADTDLTRVSTALCTAAGLPVSAANTKAVILAYITQTVRSMENAAARDKAMNAVTTNPPVVVS